MPDIPSGRLATAVLWLLLLTCLAIGGACRRQVPVASVTCQPVKLGKLGALPLLIDGELWLATFSGKRMSVAPEDGAAARSFTDDLSGETGEWRFVNAAVKPTGSALVLVMRAGCDSDCSAKILEIYPAERRVRAHWEGRVLDAGYTLQVLLPTDEPVLLAGNGWQVLRDGKLQPLCRRSSGKATWSGLSGVGYFLDDRVTIVGPSGSAISWHPPSGTFVGSAGYAGGGHVGVVIYDDRARESMIVIAENGRQIGEPLRLGSCSGWKITNCGEFAAVTCNDRIRRLTRDGLGPEMSLGRSETLIPVGGWSREAMAFRGKDEVCVVR